MLMRDDNRIDLLKLLPNLSKAQHELSHANPRIDQNLRRFTCEIKRISLRPGSERTKQNHDPFLKGEKGVIILDFPFPASKTFLLDFCEKLDISTPICWIFAKKSTYQPNMLNRPTYRADMSEKA
jgi:hypothetical protein